MANPKTIDLLQESLFSAEKREQLTTKQKELLERYQAAFTFWLDKPFMKDKDLRNFLTTNYHISPVQAYDDIKNLKFLFGKVNHAAKEWYRTMANELITTAVEDLNAETADKTTVLIATAKIRAAKALADVNRLNQVDAEAIPWENIIPQSFEPTTDPTVLGLKSIPRNELAEKIKKMKAKFSGDIDIEDITYEDINQE